MAVAEILKSLVMKKMLSFFSSKGGSGQGSEAKQASLPGGKQLDAGPDSAIFRGQLEDLKVRDRIAAIQDEILRNQGS